ncbi:MAG: hypothetical protein E7343_01265 [Clostridiales bacterium]|nr:hypothetical protein [Clostridiales bacterium]
MLIKIIVCLAILIFTTTIGYLLASKYRNRKLFFHQFCQFNERFLREIEYSKRPIKEFIQCYAYKGDFCEILNKYLEKLGAFDDFLSIFPEIGYLENEEMRVVCDYFNSLGKGDSYTQKSYFSTASIQIEEYRKKSESDYKRYADLYVKLGVLFGLAIIIVII